MSFDTREPSNTASVRYRSESALSFLDYILVMLNINDDDDDVDCIIIFIELWAL